MYKHLCRQLLVSTGDALFDERALGISLGKLALAVLYGSGAFVGKMQPVYTRGSV